MWLMIDDLRAYDTVDVVARTAEAGQRCLQLFIEPPFERLLIDHDLGEEGCTGYDVLLWAAERKLLPREVQIISMNPAGVIRMEQLLKDNGYKPIANVIGLWEREEE